MFSNTFKNLHTQISIFFFLHIINTLIYRKYAFIFLLFFFRHVFKLRINNHLIFIILNILINLAIFIFFIIIQFIF